jgi:sterol desaturase/sphingolipid hydroxylase (fatty acid hydroxylase superfamily)
MSEFDLSELPVGHTTMVQLVAYISIVTAIWWLEWRTFAGSLRGKWKHSTVNLLFMASALPIQIATSLIAIHVGEWTEAYQWGLLPLLPGSSSPWVQFGLMLLMFDLLDYTYHSTVHRVPFLWRFHLVHHSDLALDVSTTVREHPGDTLFRNSYVLFCFFMSGATVEALLMWQIAAALSNLLAHTPFRLPYWPNRVIGWIFVTPNLHHVHHHFRQPHTDRNYGNVFSLWDRLFRTLTSLPQGGAVFGVDTHMDSALTGSYARMMAAPLHRAPEPDPAT